MNIEVLVATMNQHNINLYNDMKLTTDAVFANQADSFNYQEECLNGKKIKLITTKDRGVGKNRNKALMYSSGDICLFADDDMTYVDNYDQIVINAFKEIPKADMIIFNVDLIGEGSSNHSRINQKVKKVCIFNALNYGAPRIAVKRDVLLKHNIWFSLLYGGGADYSAGEDSLFIIEAINKGMKIYTYPEKIADIRQDSSTWFEGYTEKYFIDKGIWIANAFLKSKYIISMYFAYRMRNLTNNLSILDIYRLINKGIKKFNNK